MTQGDMSGDSALPPREAVPAVSVIIAAFDAQETLGEQIEAVARQAPPFAWELLV